MSRTSGSSPSTRVSAATGAGIDEFQRGSLQPRPRSRGAAGGEARGPRGLPRLSPGPAEAPLSHLPNGHGLPCRGPPARRRGAGRGAQGRGRKGRRRGRDRRRGRRALVIGLLGGTFDPPHNGHVALAQAALEAGADRPARGARRRAARASRASSPTQRRVSSWRKPRFPVRTSSSTRTRSRSTRCGRSLRRRSLRRRRRSGSPSRRGRSRRRC